MRDEDEDDWVGQFCERNLLRVIPNHGNDFMSL